jgi:hypothetical protein
MKIPIKVTSTDGTETLIVTNPWSVMIWERKYKTKISAAVENGFGLEDLGYLAYVSAKQHGHDVPAVFDEWMKTLSDLSAGEDETNPIQGDRSDIS